MTNRIKKQKCPYHEDDRDISEYFFSHTDIRKPKHIDIYQCKKCKDHLDRAIDREERIRAHNKKQEEEANARYAKWRAKIDKREKENIWDCEVRNELCKGMRLTGHAKYLYKENIPKEILQFKRAIMKLERLINEIKEGNETKKQIEHEKEREEIERLKKPLVECKKHGLLFLVDVIKGGKSRWTGEQRYKCRQCMSDLHRDYYSRRKDYVLKKHSEYRASNPEKVKETKAKYWRKCNGKS